MAKILVIDDSRYTRLKIVQFLKDNGFEVIEAENGAIGLETVKTDQPQCIISDLLMPEMDGYQLLEQLRANDINIPVIVMTADIQETTRKKVIELGAVEVMNKPADYQKLLELLRENV